jgi:outer membrane protein assembly factor BamB
MRRPIFFSLLFLSTCVALALQSRGDINSADVVRNWPAWRGPSNNGVAPESNPPIEWAENKNVKWKIEVPGKGSATPVIWEDKIFLLTAIPTEKAAPAKPAEEAAPAGGQQRRGPGGIQPTHVQQFAIFAVSRKDGKILWQKVLREELPHEGTHPTGTWASGSAVTDGTYVFAFFGSRGLYCLDMNGRLLWEKDLGDMTIKMGFGEGASPALTKDRIIVNWDHEKDSFIVALDKKTGKEIWRTPREETTAWATPLIVEAGGKTQVITSATSRVRSYDLADGKLLWEAKGMTANTIPSPVYSDGMLYVTSGFRGNSLLAIKLAEASGEISESKAIVWRYDRDTPYVPSPLLFGDELYILKSNNGILTAFHAKSGEKLYGPERLETVPNVYASPVGAADRIYIVGREGAAAVVARGKEFKVLATNTLDDGFDASPAIAGNEIYLRGKKFLYRISKD